MLKIRQEQLDAFLAVRWDAFYRRVRLHVRKELPEEAALLGEAGLRLVFDSSVRRAESYGLRTERQIVCIVDATVLLGDRFEEREEYGWAKAVLNSPVLIADDRARLVLMTAARLAPGSEDAGGRSDST
jgi:hypothetical protein